MSQSTLLKHVAETLDRIGIKYAVTGSIASSIHGQPRSTHDIDVLIALAGELNTLDALLASFPEPEFYVNRQAAHAAHRQRGMFNVLDARTGDKVDFWFLTARQYDCLLIERCQRVRVFDVDCAVISPEDSILTKLVWMKQGGGDRQLTDVRQVLQVQRGRLDERYLNEWAYLLDVHRELTLARGC